MPAEAVEKPFIAALVHDVATLAKKAAQNNSRKKPKPDVCRALEHTYCITLNPVQELQVAAGLMDVFTRCEVLSFEEIFRKLPIHRPADKMVRFIIKEFANREYLAITADGRVTNVSTHRLKERISKLSE